MRCPVLLCEANHALPRGMFGSGRWGAVDVRNPVASGDAVILTLANHMVGVGCVRQTSQVRIHLE